MLKTVVCLSAGAVFGTIAGLLGGWDAAVLTLLIFMAVDFCSGVALSLIFKKSPKTENGAYESKAGFKGLCRKGMIILIVLVATRLDIMLGATYIRDAVCIAFIVNELISIIENAGLMGVPIPAVITNAIEVLKKKGGESDD